MDALDEQSIIVVGTDAAGLVIHPLASRLTLLHGQREDVATHLEAMLEAHPLYAVLTSMPGIAARTAAFNTAETSGKKSTGAAALSSYAVLAPTTWQSGTSINFECSVFQATST